MPKNFAQDIVVAADILGHDAPMHKYAIQMTVADVRDGALSQLDAQGSLKLGQGRHGLRADGLHRSHAGRAADRRPTPSTGRLEGPRRSAAGAGRLRRSRRRADRRSRAVLREIEIDASGILAVASIAEGKRPTGRAAFADRVFIANDFCEFVGRCSDKVPNGNH